MGGDRTIPGVLIQEQGENDPAGPARGMVGKLPLGSR